MNEQLRIRINPELIDQTTEVCEELGITPTAAVSMLFAQMVRVTPHGVLAFTELQSSH